MWFKFYMYSMPFFLKTYPQCNVSQCSILAQCARVQRALLCQSKADRASQRLEPWKNPNNQFSNIIKIVQNIVRKKSVFFSKPKTKWSSIVYECYVYCDDLFLQQSSNINVTIWNMRKRTTLHGFKLNISIKNNEIFSKYVEQYTTAVHWCSTPGRGYFMCSPWI